MKKLMKVRCIQCIALCSIFVLFFSCDKKETEEPVEENNCAWTDFNNPGYLGGSMRVNAFTYNSNGFVLFQGGNSYTVDVNNHTYTSTSLFPPKEKYSTNFTGIDANNNLYVFSSQNDTLYRYSSGKWEIECALPFYYGTFGGYHHGFAVGNTLYLLSTRQSFSYNLDTKEWNTKAVIPPDDPDYSTGGYSFAGTNYNGKAYVLKNEGSIFEYDPATDEWKYLTKYPGEIKEKIVSFAYSNKLYFGFSYIEHSPSYGEVWMDNKLYSFDLTEKAWKDEEESIPYELAFNRIFSFFVGNKLYIGHEYINNSINLYSFDPAKKL